MKHMFVAKFKGQLTRRTKAGIAFYIIVAGVLIIASCSRSLYRERSDRPSERTAIPDNENFSESDAAIDKDFLKAGSELSLGVGNAGAGQIIETAMEYFGVPHCMGGATSKCMDCSGLLLTAFASHGIRLPHSAEEQARYGRIIQQAGQLKRGDLVFFTRSYRTKRYITHSGIYLGNNEFIHASSTSGVTITSLNNPWWREKFVFGTRLFEKE